MTPLPTLPSLQLMRLRPYQSEAIAAVIAARRRGVRRQLLCLPTGAGKTVVFSELARRARRPVLVLAHRQELVDQAVDKLARVLGDGAAISVERARERALAETRVVVASIRSLSDERLERLRATRAPGLVVYDECHHAPAEDNRRVLRGLGVLEPDWDGTLLGVTATPLRADGLPLGDLFEEIVYAKTLGEMIVEGWLVPLRGFRVETGERLHDLDGAAREEESFEIDLTARNDLVARAIQELARDRRTIVFCQDVAHARGLARRMNAIGVRTGLVHGALDTTERVRVLRDFREGRLEAVTNVMVLTEGFDDPGVQCVAMARPTKSSALYAQCVGRGLRPAPGKKDCLVLDFVDLSDLPLVTLPSLFGMPREIDLEGEVAHEAAGALAALLEEHPGFEWDLSQGISLAEIQERARGFDPLTLAIDPQVVAISPFAWTSLGSKGLALAHRDRRGRFTHFVVRARRERGGAGRWAVHDPEGERARFGTLLEAVEAVDYEIRRAGESVVASAARDAPWRSERVPPELDATLAALPLPRPPRDHGEARDLLLFARFGPARGRRGS